LADKYRILIVEDDVLIAMELGERLGDMGYEVMGPAHTLDEAKSLLAVAQPDAALLDANLNGESSVPLGAALAARGVPLAFCTGYDAIKNLPPELAHAPVLTKPIGEADLIAGLKRLFN
jgi:DNA-binding response OmpR family regulator